MSAEDDINWNEPIVARPMPGPGPGGRPRYHLAEVRAEQIRRAAILLAAAGARPMTPRTTATTIRRLAIVVPGIRYHADIFDVFELAPSVPVLFADNEEAVSAGGRPSTRTPEWLMTLAQVADERRAESPNLKSDIAVATSIRNRFLRFQSTMVAAHTADGNAKEAERVKALKVPGVKALARYIKMGRDLRTPQ